jgi:hypothetical protein
LISSHDFLFTAEGSFQAIADFILPLDELEPYWRRMLRKFCNSFKVTPISFLGSGAHGNVFCVQRLPPPEPSASESTSSTTSTASLATSDHLALKVVEYNYSDDLFHEHAKLQKLLSNGHHPCLPTYVSAFVNVDSMYDEESAMSGSGMMVQPVGEQMWHNLKPHANPSEAKIILDEVLDALFELHHIVGAVHGDARLANLIRVDKTLVWIDFRKSIGIIDVVDDVQRWWDMHSLLENFCHYYGAGKTKTHFEHLAVAYAAISSPDISTLGFVHFKEAVWEIANSHHVALLDDIGEL